MPIKAVIFDLDDTLYLERDYAFSGFRAVANAFSDALGDPKRACETMIELFDTDQRGRVFNQTVETLSNAADDALVQDMIETFRNHTPTIGLLPDAEDAITRLRGRYQLGLITDGPAGGQRAKINALDLENRLDEIIVTDELGPGSGKPSPVPYEKMARALKYEHRECVYVADNAAKDFVAPNILGWLSVQIVRKMGVYRDVRPAAGGQPTAQIHTLDELDALLTSS